jgi:hypothetical protein
LCPQKTFLRLEAGSISALAAKPAQSPCLKCMVGSSVYSRQSVDVIERYVVGHLLKDLGRQVMVRRWALPHAIVRPRR